jgi:hypothetical protein
MTSLRKWRFPILIGSGLIAAGVLIYFSQTHVGTDKTQGAIGKRDVYRDGQVNSADVATPGTAPVATQAILESSEFKALAKNQAFQELKANSDFNALSSNMAFHALMRNADFLSLASHPEFLQLVNSDLMKAYLVRELKTDELFSRMRADSHYEALSHEHGLTLLLQDKSFLAMARLGTFQGLMASHELSNALADHNLRDELMHGALESQLATASHPVDGNR